jgi:pimeloyl-ACP methyl ester carboxylesterase
LASSAEKPPDRRRSIKRLVCRWAIYLGSIYFVACLLMWFIENQLVYHPLTAAEAWEPAPVATIQDLELTSPGGNRIHAWWLPNKTDKPALLFCPGNGGNLSGRGPSMVRIAEKLDTSVLIFDYPGYGKSEGKPNEANCYDAAEAAIRWLNHEKHLPSERIILYGESLGGGVATEMASRHQCRALVLVKTFTSLPATAKCHYPWLPCNWLMSNRFDSITKLPAIHSPVFVTSATADRIVPYEQGESLFRAANEPKQFFRDEGSDHNDPLREEFWSSLCTFLDSHPPAK